MEAIAAFEEVIIDKESCRICLSPRNAFVHVFGRFHKHSVENLIYRICQVKLSRNKSLPQYICENCLSRMLLADTIRNLCEKNEKFLNDLAESEAQIKVDRQKTVKVDSNKKYIRHQTDPKYQTENVKSLIKSPKQITEEEEIHSSVSIADHIDLEPYLKLNKKSKECFQNANKFYCSFCFKDFNTLPKCMYHEKTKHAMENHLKSESTKPFTCDRCGLNFKNKSHVMNHLNVVHMKIKRYHCNVCGFAMYSKTHHTNHMKSHKNLREFKCNECCKEFIRKESLLVHQRTHTNERPYKCKYCNRCYSAHTDLKRHIFSHTQIHPYICQICNEGFFLKRLLNDHVITFHPGVDTTNWLTGKTLHNF
ncbi:CLUMA_CG008143, isoform A [Clunio marinus]|uniref:CLUMA_CG008143, isoform A n=1 Tax=Clunio marinus TaxID=568069 RepID=A0A1J1I4X4_9DIPT|nr:CLUMA_CG008143, isoform A [Clunio marinus]